MLKVAGTSGVVEGQKISTVVGSEVMPEIGDVKDAVAGIIAPFEVQEQIDYQKLAQEHLELISQGKNSVEIAQWIGDKLNILSWKNGEFLGERKALSSPASLKVTQRLQRFVEALGKSWTKANQSSKTHSQYLLLDGYVQNALFGSKNMNEIDASLGVFYSAWHDMGDDFVSKEAFLSRQIDLAIEGKWSNLIGVNMPNGDFVNPDAIFVSSVLIEPAKSSETIEILKFYIDQHAAEFSIGDPSSGRLCLLN